MASFTDEAALPALPPIKTAPLAAPSPPAAPAAAAPSSRAAAPQVVSAAADTTKAEDQEPSTPTSEESRLRQPTECPPAPRKPPAPRLPAKRKSTTPTARVCLRVPRDLSAVFRSMPMPPEKRIRAS